MKAINQWIINQFKLSLDKIPLKSELTWGQIILSFKGRKHFFIYENEIYLLLPLLTLILGIQWFNSIQNFIYENYPISGKSDFIYLTIFCALELITFTLSLYIYKTLIFAKTEVVLFLNHALPGKTKREEEIIRIWKNFLSDSGHSLQKDLLLEWEILGAKKFCRKYFKTSNSNFINYYTERAYLKTLGEVDIDFIHYSLIIPKLESLTIDAVRRILIYPVKCTSLYKEWMEFLFQNYTPNQIERIFTNHHGKEDLNELINLNANPLEIYASFSELFMKENTKEIPEYFSNLPPSFKGYKFKVLKSRAEYDQASDFFSNCVRDYFDEEGYFILVMKKSTPCACIHINNKKIIELKGYNNQECLDRNLITNFLRTYEIIK